MWNLENDKNESIYKAETDSQMYWEEKQTTEDEMAGWHH